MKFSRVYGKTDPSEVKRCQDKLSLVCLELATSPDATSMANSSKLGGDPFLFALIMPIEHVLTNSIPTAATDGAKYYWSAPFILNSSYLKLRLTCLHEALHAKLMHPQRVGKRDMRLWNIAVDFIVMGMIFDWLKHFAKRKNAYLTDEQIKERAIELFREAFGNYITFEQLKAKYADPNQKIPGTENWTPEPFDLEAIKREFNIERSLTEEEAKALQAAAVSWRYCYADPDLPPNLKMPESIYDELLKVIPKCGTCGRLGIYHPPGKRSHDPNCPMKELDGHCDECCSGMDVFGGADTLDTHLPCVVDPEVLARRLSNAVDMAKRSSKPGYVPAGIEEDLAALSEPKIHWMDDVRMTNSKIRSSGTRNDHTRYRTRPMAMGMLVPRKRTYTSKFVCLLDTSGSVSKEQAALGISQLQSLEGSEGMLVCCDSEVYWNAAIELADCREETLSTIKMTGRGGTRLAPFFEDFEDRLGKRDMVIAITDGELAVDDIESMIDPGVPVYWLLVGESDFNPKFGKVFKLESR